MRVRRPLGQLMSRWIWVISWLALWPLGSGAQTFSPPVRLSPTPGSPEIAVDASGTIDITYGSAEGLVFRNSMDGGKTFSDPVEISSSNNISIQRMIVEPEGPIDIVTIENWNIFFYRSTDGGSSFSKVQITSAGDLYCARPLPQIAVNDSNVYLLWYWTPEYNCSDGPFPPAPIADEVFFSYSQNHGASFSPPSVVVSTGFIDWQEIAVSPNGNVNLAWSYNGPGSCNVQFMHSSDGGATFSPLTNVVPPQSGVCLGLHERFAIDSNNAVDMTWEQPGAKVADGETSSTLLFSRSTDGGDTFLAPLVLATGVAIGQRIGIDAANHIDISWEDFETSEILFRNSTDNGSTFSPPVLVNPDGSVVDGPIMAIDRYGNIDILLSEAKGTHNVPISDMMFSRSTDGGRTFSVPQDLSNNPAPRPGLLFRHPMAVESSGNVDLVWDACCDNPAETYFTPGMFFERVIVPNFTISAAPGAQTLLPGGVAKVALTLTATGGFSDAVNLSCTNLPSGATCAFNSSTITPKASGSPATLTVTTPPTMAQGNYTFTITATSGDTKHTQDVQLAVGGITSSILPASQVIPAGSSADFAVTLNSTNGFAGQVTLACGGLPSGLGCSFMPPQPTLTANGSATSTLTVNVSSKPSGSLTQRQLENWPGPVSSNLPLMAIGFAFVAAALFMFALPSASPGKVLWARSDWARGFGMMALIVFVALGLLSCGGVTSSSGGSGAGAASGGGTGVTGGTSGSGGTGDTGGGTGGSGGTGGTGGGTGGGSTSVTAQIAVQAQSGGATVNLGAVSVTVP